VPSAGTTLEADALNPAIEGDVSTDHVLPLVNLSLCPRKFDVWKLQFIDILKVIHNPVLLQLVQKRIDEYGA
jgi:hypothetical protein